MSKRRVRTVDILIGHAAFSGWMADLLSVSNDPECIKGTPYEPFKPEIDGLIHVLDQVREICQTIARKVLREELEQAGFHATLKQAEQDMSSR